MKNFLNRLYLLITYVTPITGLFRIYDTFKESINGRIINPLKYSFDSFWSDLTSDLDCLFLVIANLGITYYLVKLVTKYVGA